MHLGGWHEQPYPVGNIPERFVAVIMTATVIWAKAVKDSGAKIA